MHKLGEHENKLPFEFAYGTSQGNFSDNAL